MENRMCFILSIMGTRAFVPLVKVKLGNIVIGIEGMIILIQSHLGNIFYKRFDLTKRLESV